MLSASQVVSVYIWCMVMASQVECSVYIWGILYEISEVIYMRGIYFIFFGDGISFYFFVVFYFF